MHSTPSSSSAAKRPTRHRKPRKPPPPSRPPAGATAAAPPPRAPASAPAAPSLTIPSPAEAEGIVLRLAEHMDKGAGNHSDVRAKAREHLRGLVAGWAILGLFTDARRDQINLALDAILSTATLSAPGEDTALGLSPAHATASLAHAEPARCRECGCTDADCSGCIARTGRPCHWVQPDLCSACAPTPAPQGTGYPEAVDLVRRAGMASIVGLEHMLNIGRAQATRLIERMQAERLIGPADMFGVHRVGEDCP